MIRAGILGFGFMGRTHLGAYRAAAVAGLPVRVTTVCDPSMNDPSRQANTGNLPSQADQSLEGVNILLNPDDFLASPDIDLVSICTYTDSHVDYACKALAAGKHVIVEKPLALRSRDIEPLVQAAAKARTRCMPAMCMRFWPGWDWLHEAITSGRFGAVRSATFHRVGAGPSWASDFYRDASRSGGALIDLHIHDVDFLYWCFGRPRSLVTSGHVNHLSTLYDMDHTPPHLTAEGGWSFLPGAGFRMRYCICFEHATADFDLARPTPLLLTTDAGTSSVALPEGSGYSREVAHLVEVIARGSGDLRATLDDAIEVARILECEQESLRTGQRVTLPI